MFARTHLEGAMNLFRYSDLQSFLTETRMRYRVTPLREWHETPSVILRHDVDLDVGAAHRLAQLEQACGVHSSFFFLTNSPYYNVRAEANRRLLSEMAGWGFEIGLHFDPTVYGGASEERLRSFVDEEAHMLGALCGVRVESISVHNPSIHGKYPLFEGYRNAYDPRIFSPECYISDSRMFFRHDPRRFLERAATRTVQMLLHPMHYTEHGEGYERIFTDWARRVIQQTDEDYRLNETYEATVKPDLLSALYRRAA
jgi:hypothetical protein